MLLKHFGNFDFFLFSFLDILYSQFVGCGFVFSGEYYEFYAFAVGIFELLAEFRRVGVYLAGVSGGTAAGSGAQYIGKGGLAHVGEEVFGTADGLLGEFVQAGEYVVDPVGAE